MIPPWLRPLGTGNEFAAVDSVRQQQFQMNADDNEGGGNGNDGVVVDLMESRTLLFAVACVWH